MDERYLREALDLARRRRGFASPNPAVGAIVVAGGRTLGRGFHWGAGHPHAEVEALKYVTDACGATVYVTLEPCCHFGRTPPCTQLLIERQVARVVFAYRDPNPLVAGNGMAALRAAGIACEQVSVAEIDRFYESYAYWTTTRQPFITAKIALTLDGCTAGADGAPVAISGPQLSGFTHAGRRAADAILTSERTITCDNPRLNARTLAEVFPKPIYIIDRQAKLSVTAEVFRTAESLTLFYGADAPEEKLARLREENVRLIEVPQRSTAAGAMRLSLPDVLEQIGADGRHDLWVEAGGTLFASLVAEHTVKRAYVYVAPKWLGTQGLSAFPNGSEGLFSTVRDLHWTGVGQDALCEMEW